MKIVFLDFDGVLNSEKFMKKRVKPKDNTRAAWNYTRIDQKTVSILNRITDETNANIVLSSTWRLGRTLDEVQSLFNMLNIKGTLIGKTGHYHYTDNRGGIHSLPRGEEIKSWLRDNILQSNFKNYVIIDDDSDMLLEQKDNFFKTDYEIGLTNEIADDIITFLNKQK